VSRPSLLAIREIVCAEFRITSQGMLSDDPWALHEAARRAAMWLAYCHAYDCPEIGRHFDRAPATVRDMIYRLDGLIETDPAIADRMIGLAVRLDRAC
jgi:chromosomal replication initiation ATPase DnaA